MKYRLLFLISSLFMLTACSDSFLDRAPEGNYVDVTYYTSDKALEQATAPLYNRAWFDFNQRSIVPLGSNRANDNYSKWGYPEFTEFKVTALSTNLSAAWKGLYAVITMANSVISDIQNKCSSDVSEQAKRKATAEARLMRACAYFYMVRLWGSVIIIEDNAKMVENPIQPRHNEDDVIEFIIRDLTYAAENLPETPSAKGRATSWGAKGMLAKVYLARAGWHGGMRNTADLEKSKEYAADVINNSGLKLYTNYEDLFKYKHNNNPESLIAMQWVPLGEWGVCNTLLADLAGNTTMTGGINVWSSYQGSIDMLQQYELADTLRRNATFCTPGTYYSYICIADGGYTYTGNTSCIKKGVPGGPNDDNDGYIQSMNSPLNTYILRLADVYLTYAEACLGNQNELTDGPGLEAFNLVRERARIEPKDRITFEDIIRERRVEFSMEYCNWYDMVSWYHWKPEFMLDYFKHQHRGWTVDRIWKDTEGGLHFGKKSGNDYLEGEANWNKPSNEVEINHDNILMPYPESDVIQNPLLKEDPVPYEFSE